MNRFLGALLKLPNYLKAFGLLAGVRLFAALELTAADGPGGLQAVRVPGLRHPVWLRRTTSDRSIFWQVFVKQEYAMDEFPQSRELHAAYRAAVARGETPVIVDAGSNIGMSVAWFAQAFPAARIVAVEPDQANLAVLRRNAALCPNVEVVAGGVWNVPLRLDIANPDAGAGAFRLATTAEGAVQGYTIDQLLDRAGTDRALIVKIDIEGGEEALFESNVGWLDRASLVVMELHDWLLPWKGTSRPFFAAVSRRPFDFLFRGENLFCFRAPATAAEIEAQPGRPARAAVSVP